jgi:amino acid transporter
MNFNLNSGSIGGLSSLYFIGILAIWLITAIIHISLAIGVLEDTERLLKNERRGTFLVGSNTWALATLLGGIITAAIYWAIHHSNLRPTLPDK